MFDKSHDISVLNSLIETTIDSVDGYRRSAQEATNSRFSAAFLERANEREQIVSKLRDEVRRLGGNPEDDGSVLAAARTRAAAMHLAALPIERSGLAALAVLGPSGSLAHRSLLSFLVGR